MIPFRSFLSRHALRLLLLLAGAATLASAPPALSSGLPGPGLWPRLAGAGLFFCALALPAPRRASPGPSAPSLRRSLGLVAACLLWLVLMPFAGWLPATFISCLLACRAGGCTLKESLVLCCLLSAALWLGMERLLEYSLPQGTLFSLVCGD